MFRSISGLAGGIALVLAAAPGPAAAQRPAAWDTRVIKPPPAAQPAEPQDQPTPPQSKDKPAKPLDTAGGGKSGKPKTN